MQVLLVCVILEAFVITLLRVLVHKKSKEYTEAYKKFVAFESQKDISSSPEIQTGNNDYIAMLVHELRSPLSVIRGASDLLIKELATLEANQIHMLLSQIRKSSTGLLGLVNDILDVSKMKAGKFEIHKVRGNLIELIKEVTSYIDPLIQVKGIHLTLDVKSDYNELAFDAERLRQVLNNLLSNAIKFTPKDGEITIRVIQIANGIEIRVSDTGIGIPDMDKETLFHKFMQGHNNGNSDKDKGTGLGLVIAKGIIEAHGGKIWIEDNKPKGACFIFDLPINSFGGEVAL